MPIDFSLKVAHPLYQDLIVETIENLAQMYPAAPLRKVLVYLQESAKNCADCANRSLGDATEPGAIRLNGYWFSKPPSALYSAGEADDFMPNLPKIRWHGGLPQPGQVMVHEFFHILRDGLGQDAEEFSKEMWLKATSEPEIVFSGYSLYNPSEWWAESGAALVLGENSNPQVIALAKFLTAIIAKDGTEGLTIPFDPSKHPRGPGGEFRKGH